MMLLLAGTSATFAQTLTVDSTSIDFGTVTQNAGTVTRTFTVRNTSNAPVPLIGLVGQPTNPVFQVNGGQAFTLAPSQSQTVTVTFTPTMSGNYSDSVSITSNGGNAVVRLHARAAFAADSSLRVKIDSTMLDFGNVPQGNTRQQSFTIRNTTDSTAGDSTRVLTGTVLPPTDPAFTIISGAGAYTLRRGESRVVTVQFNPTTSRSYLDSIRISSNAANDSGAMRVLLRGRSFTGADTNTRITIRPRTLDFGSVSQGSTNEQSFTIFNSDTTTGTGDTNRRLSGTVSAPSNPAFVITSGVGAFSLRRGETRVVTVRFMPTTGQQNYSDSIRVTSNAINDSLGFSNVYLLGRVGNDSTNANRLFVDRQVLSFGTVPNGQTATQSFTIRNQDSSSTNGPIVGSVDSPTGGGFTIISGGGPFSLNRGESRVVTVQFNPTGNQSTNYSDSIRITSNIGDPATPRVVYLQGSGSQTTGVENESAIAGLSLGHNYPNPFSRTSTVTLVLPRAMHVTLALYNSQGVQVASVANETFPAGEHHVTVNAETLASGNYLLQMRAGNSVQTAKITVAR
jgi:hypothetical protein